MVKPNYRDEIQTVAEDRKIEFLLHFTQAANLASIVEHGFLSRRELAGSEYLAYASDHFRLDKNEHAVSVSVSRPNEVMLASKRRSSNHSDWVVLVLPSDILWTHDCLFCWRNAATKEIREHRPFRGGPWAFKKMFAGSDEARSGLAPCHPTDPQAEVQVLERIAPELIRGAVVDRWTMKEPVKAILDNLPGERRSVEVEGF